MMLKTLNSNFLDREDTLNDLRTVEAEPVKITAVKNLQRFKMK